MNQIAEIINKVDDQVELLATAQAIWGMSGVSTAKVHVQVTLAKALQTEIRTWIRTNAATTPDADLEMVLVYYSKLLDAKLELVNVISG